MRYAPVIFERAAQLALIIRVVLLFEPRPSDVQPDNVSLYAGALRRIARGRLYADATATDRHVNDRTDEHPDSLTAADGYRHGRVDADADNYSSPDRHSPPDADASANRDEPAH